MDCGQPCFRPDFACLAVLEIQAAATYTYATGLSPAVVCRSRHFTLVHLRCWHTRTCTGSSHNPVGATRACLARQRFRRQPVSLATTPGGVPFPPGTEMFQFPDLPPLYAVPSLSLGGLPHSDTVGSLRDRHSPTLSLRICVLRRHDMPRHPPHAFHPLPGLRSLDNTKKPVTTLTMNLFRCWCSAAYAADERDVNPVTSVLHEYLRSLSENGLREALAP